MRGKRLLFESLESRFCLSTMGLDTAAPPPPEGEAQVVEESVPPGREDSALVIAWNHAAIPAESSQTLSAAAAVAGHNPAFARSSEPTPVPTHANLASGPLSLPTPIQQSDGWDDALEELMGEDSPSNNSPASIDGMTTETRLMKTEHRECTELHVSSQSGTFVFNV